MCLPHTRKRPQRVYDLDPYLMNGEILTIDAKYDTCSICGGDFKHSKKCSLTEKTPDGLEEVIFKTAHNGCLKIMARIRHKRAEILDLEFQLFCKQD